MLSQVMCEQIKVADRANKSKQKAIKTLIARKDSPRKVETSSTPPPICAIEGSVQRKPENDVEASKVKKGCYDLKRSPSLARSLTPPSYSHSYTNSSPKPAGLLSRPAPVARPPTPPLDLDHISETLKKKNVVASQLKFGFLGLGIMGRGIVKNLLHSGHQVTIWNRTPSKAHPRLSCVVQCNDFLKVGAVKGQTPADVVAASDITFSCVSDPEVAKEIVFGNCGVLQEIRASKGYVEMTSLDPQTSNDISDAGTATTWGWWGAAAKMSLMLHSILGATLASMAEAISLADRVGVSHKDLLEVLELGILDPLKLIEKGKALSRSRTFEWFSRFQKGREKVNDDQHTGRPRSLRCEENKLKIKEIVKSNRRISIKDLSSETGLSVGLCHQIVTKDLDMIRTSSKFVPRILTEEQKEYDPETKRESSQWIERGEPKPKKARFTKSKVKTLLVTFFDISGLVHHEFIPFGRTINQEVYLGIMSRLREAVRLKRPERVKTGILNRGGRYLEAQMVGSKDAAEDGSLIVLTAGDRSLFNECTSCFQVIGRHCYYLGVVGAAAKMSLMLHSILGATLASMAEAISLADRVGVSHKDLLEVLELGILDPLKLIEKGKAMMDSSLGTKMPLRHMQKDLSLALNLGEKMGQPLPLMAAANEMYKHAKQLGYADHDVSAIYLGVRF
ncbi:GLYR1 [Cordylochernes scorpioides]|uniref:GLYR1 n=1 Tax=Cordylochernes scorpioides TaxID=51811 RepID=A0ABY6KW11_9ARAC|nr:GLYR1 [Cordylochernes scorpioides]